MYILIKYDMVERVDMDDNLVLVRDVVDVYGLFDNVEEGIRYARDRTWTEFQVVVLNEV